MPPDGVDTELAWVAREALALLGCGDSARRAEFMARKRGLVEELERDQE